MALRAQPHHSSGIPGSITILTANPSPGFFLSSLGFVYQSGGRTISSASTNPAIFTFGNSDAHVTANFSRSFVVTNVFALQRETNKLVDVRYDLSASAPGNGGMLMSASQPMLDEPLTCRSFPLIRLLVPKLPPVSELKFTWHAALTGTSTTVSKSSFV